MFWLGFMYRRARLPISTATGTIERCGPRTRCKHKKCKPMCASVFIRLCQPIRFDRNDKLHESRTCVALLTVAHSTTRKVDREHLPAILCNVNGMHVKMGGIVEIATLSFCFFLLIAFAILLHIVEIISNFRIATHSHLLLFAADVDQCNRSKFLTRKICNKQQRKEITN